MDTKLLTGSLLYVTVICILSCGGSSKLVYQNKATGSKVRYYVTRNPNYTKGEGKFYARVDSGDIRIFYSFKPNNIYKTYNNESNYLYTLVFDKEPIVNLTSLDKYIFLNSDKLLDSLKYNDLKRAKNATGFVVEIAGH